ncbi:MAG TPA: acyl-CoA dehydrogenase family protein [Amycolatopsis sp.]|nr:acyl-CoA dehydrogenase family protein [Amycolatopsis sp.]
MTTTTTAAEREDLRAAIRAFLADHLDEATVRELAETGDGFARQMWAQFAGDLGVAGVLVPEEFGGQGLSTVELGIVLQESGRALLGAPFLGSAVLATAALLRAGDEPAAKKLLPALAEGSAVAALAVDDDPGTAVVATATGGAWRLSGRKRHVVDLPAADTVLVVAAADGGTGLFAVRADGQGVHVEPSPSLDLTRKVGQLRLQDAVAERIGGDFTAGLAAVSELGAFACAAEQAGAAARCLEIEVDYAKTREQFGRVIGFFQAIKHRLAEHLALVEQMRAAVEAAAVELAENSSAAETVSVVKAYCGEAGSSVAEGLIDTLGGIGFTWEHVAHLYLRRVKTLAYLFGSPAEHRERLADQLGMLG